MSAEGRVLVIDSEPLVQEVVRRRLREAGYETDLAGSGREALSLASKGGVEVALLSLTLPDGDGLRVLERLRAIPVMEGVPIALIAAAHEIDGITRGLARGADDFIRKPIERVELVA